MGQYGMIRTVVLMIVLTLFAGYFFHLGIYYYSVKCMYSQRISTEQHWTFHALKCEW